MPSPFDDPDRDRRHRRGHRRHSTPPVEAKPDYLVIGLCSALFVLFMIGTISALLR